MMSNFITDDMVEKSLNYLRDNAEELGHLKGRVEYYQHERKVVRGQAFLDSEEKTAAAREAEAESCAAYRHSIQELADAVTVFTTLQTKMKAAEIKLETWRSLNARSGRGHI